MNAGQNDAKRVFWKKGTCSQALCYLLDREFGCLKENEERATDPLAGGIWRRGHQCGMLWGSVLAAGAEACRRHRDRDRAIGVAMTASRRLVESFINRTGSADCRDITGCDWTSARSIAKHMLTGKVFRCFTLAEKWAPEAIRAAGEGLAGDLTGLPGRPLSCASAVAGKMGASDGEMALAAGFAGGIGLSGNACGALGAAIWMKALAWCREHPGKALPFGIIPGVKNTLTAFDEAAGREMRCHKITGRRFRTVAEHTEFVKDGGCGELIDRLALS